MARVVKVELANVLSELPVLVEIGDFTTFNSEQDDLFICALGFEPRCLSIPEFFARSGYRTRYSMYFEYSTNRDDNAINLTRLKESLETISPVVRRIEADIMETTNNISELIEHISAEADGHIPVVTFDISVAANRLIMKAMKILLNHNIILRIVYCEAEKYHPTKEECDIYFISPMTNDVFGLEQGVGNVQISMDYPGHHLDALPDCVIIFPCFRAERSKAVLSLVDPSLLTDQGNKVHWMLGVPHLTKDRWRLDAMRKINEINTNMKQHEICTFDYRKALKILQDLYDEHSEYYRITLAPIGSKMQSLGTALFCYMHPDIRVIIAAPKEYNAKQYSEGCRDMWKIEVGQTINLRNSLDKVGILQIVESDALLKD